MSSVFIFLFLIYVYHRHIHSFPTRRSSDLHHIYIEKIFIIGGVIVKDHGNKIAQSPVAESSLVGDRKSTRLNSSHVSISYAVFCLKKKNKIIINSYTLSDIKLVCIVVNRHI